MGLNILTSKYSPSTIDISSMMSRLHLRQACAEAGRFAKSMQRCRLASPAPIPQNECNVTPPEMNQTRFIETKNHSPLHSSIMISTTLMVLPIKQAATPVDAVATVP